MQVADSTVRSIVHHKERSTAGGLDAEVENGDNVWMLQTDVPRFVEEHRYLFRRETDVEDFNGNLRFAIDILGQVDIAKMPLSEQADQMIPVNLFTGAVCHNQSSSAYRRRSIYIKVIVGYRVRVVK